MAVDVVVPTYCRPGSLDRCLQALASQQRPADRVLVVARQDDIEAHAVIESHIGRLLGVELVTVAEPGQLAAMAAGIKRSTGDILAFTDDDAAPRPEWIVRLLAHFREPTVGGVGGRDVIRGQEHPRTDNVGRLRCSGRLTGMHHLGTGQARDVDVLKGVNMAFRAEALALPSPGVLRGSGAQVDNEIVTCAWARRHGWRVVYDPAIEVDHEPAPRSGSDQRVRPEPVTVADAAFNSLIAASTIGRSALVRHAAYGLAIGTRDRPGFVRALLSILRREPDVCSRLSPALRGRLDAICALLRREIPASGPSVQTVEELREPSSRRPRITLVAHDIYDAGGMERACAELVRALNREFDITVISATLAEDLRPLVRWRQVPVIHRPFLVKFIVFFVLGGITVRRERGDLVHTVGAIVPNRADVAGLHFCHAAFRAANDGLRPVNAPALRRANTGIASLVALWAERWCYRPERLGVLGAVSEGGRLEAIRHFPGVPVTLTANGVDTVRFRPDHEVRSAIRRAAGVGTDTCIALFVGGDWDRKGLALAVEGLAKARAQGVDIVLWVVGPGDQARFATTARNLDVAAVVRFFGSRDDIEPFYQAAELFLLPSIYETFSLVCFEAAACGLPLVIPRISGAGELVGDDEAGIIVEREADSIAAALRSLAIDRPKRIGLGKEARRRASQFSWEASTAAVADLYRSLLSQDAR